jgi:hypothetical protein
MFISSGQILWSFYDLIILKLVSALYLSHGFRQWECCWRDVNFAPTCHPSNKQVCEVENDLERATILLKEALNCNAKHKLAALAVARIQLARCCPMLSFDNKEVSSF